MADSTEEKTEQASDRKMKEVRSKGQLGKSQDLTAWVGVGIAGAVIPLTVSAAARAATDQVLSLRTVIENPEPAVALQLAQDALGSVVPTMLPLLGAIAVAVLLASVAQGGLHLKRLRPEADQFNPMSGLKRMFGAQALWLSLDHL